MVIIIHVTAFISLDKIATYYNYYFYRETLNFAVSYFFAITGYFLATHNDFTKTFKQLKKYIYIYLFASFSMILLNGLMVLIKYFVFETPITLGFKQILSNITLQNLFKGTIGSYHLWFFVSLIIVLLFYYYFFKYKTNKLSMIIILFISFVLFRVNALNINSYIDVSGVSRGILFVSLGYFSHFTMRKYRFHLLIVTINILLISFFSYFKFYSINEILLLISLFMLLNYFKYNDGNNTFVAKMGKHTLSVYIFHDFFRQLISLTWYYLKLPYYNYLYLVIILNIVISFSLSPFLYTFFNKLYAQLSKLVFTETKNRV